MKNKLLAVILSFVCIIGCAFALPACSLTDGVLEYTKIDGGYEVAKRKDNSAKKITIPATFKNEPVISIGEWAFEDCKNLESVEIPDSVTTIKVGAFHYCTNLAKVNIPAGVTSIENCTFEGCNISSVEIHAGIAYIGDSAFRNCGSLEYITVSRDNAFYHSAGNCLIQTETKTLILGCKNSKIPSDGSVDNIGYYAFYGCRELKNIEIPDSVTYIGQGAFAYCVGLTRLTIPEGVITIEGYAFGDCSGLERIIMPASVALVGANAFEGCKSLEFIFYKGTAVQWNLIEFKYSHTYFDTYFLEAKRYDYSEENPFVGGVDVGRFWHYSDGRIVIWTDNGDALI
ncbi:MAG: leucine-rich repeat domain-containing protein [Clostridiales bacterium]|nr:leucine-rich repeat domain-containing protein [Clostridiales bacterium]